MEIVKILIEAKSSVNIRERVRLHHTLVNTAAMCSTIMKQIFFFLHSGRSNCTFQGNTERLDKNLSATH